MDILPIVFALRRHKAISALVALEIAICFAILSNAIFIVEYRLIPMYWPSGLQEDALVVVGVRSSEELTQAGQRNVTAARQIENIAAFRSIPNVRAVAMINTLPLTTDSWQSYVTLTPNQKVPSLRRVEQYIGGRNIADVLGLRLISGRDFSENEYGGFEGFLPKASVCLITKSMADKLFPGESALGKSFYDGVKRLEVIGVLDHLLHSSIRLREEADDSLLMPAAPSPRLARYVLRVDPEARGSVLKALNEAISTVSTDQALVPNVTQLYSDIRADYFRQDKAFAWLLLATCFAMVLVTGFGIAGLVSYWVRQRTLHIGIRRALGATKRDVLQYFLMENFAIVTSGILLGVVLAFALSVLITMSYEIPRLPAIYLLIGACALWLVGQLATLGPAIRALQLPPSVALRVR